MPTARGRRQALKVVWIAAGGSAAVTLAPFVGKTLLETKSVDNGALVEVDLSRLAPGELLTVDWQGQPVWVLRRTPEMLASLAIAADLIDPHSEQSKQPAYARNAHRSLTPEIFVAIGLCTHLGCAPTPRLRRGNSEGMPTEWRGGFACPCHTSTFDLAGRVHRGRNAQLNLAVPPYRLAAQNRLVIGEDPLG